MLRLRDLLLCVAMASVAGCGPAAPPPHPSYDPATRRLVRLDVDLNGDGRVDARTYLEGNRPLRSEIDEAGTGRIDRWEYFDAAGQLVRVGTSSAGDGLEDTWTHALTPEGERRVDLSTARDRRLDRREFYVGDDLVRAEDDVNGDGQPDKWETYESGVLRVVGVDTTYGAGRPDRRVVYDADGQFSHVEADGEGTGVFTRVDPEGIR